MDDVRGIGGDGDGWLLFSEAQDDISGLADELNDMMVPAVLVQEFELIGISLSENVQVEVIAIGSEWKIQDEEHLFLVKNEDDTLNIYDGGDSDFLTQCVNARATLCQAPFGVRLGDGENLQLAGLISFEKRSHSFSMYKDQQFTIEGLVVEGDDMREVEYGAPFEKGDKPSYTYAYLGGFSGLPWFSPDDGGPASTAPNLGIFDGNTLLSGESLTKIQFPFDTGDTIDVGASLSGDQTYTMGDSPSGNVLGKNLPSGFTFDGHNGATGVERMGVKGYLSAFIIISNIETEFDANATSTPSPLLAAALGSDVGSPPITTEQVQPLLAQATQRFVAAGMDLAPLDNVQILVSDLPGATLGQAVGNTIFLDINAAGHGWFIDTTPWEDSEFTTRGDQGEQGRIDALTVITHELGHILGLGHDGHGVMQPTLAASERHLPSDNDQQETEVSDLWDADPLDAEIWDALLESWTDKKIRSR